MPAYPTSYAEHFDLVEHIRCNARVDRVAPAPADRREVALAGGSGGSVAA